MERKVTQRELRNQSGEIMRGLDAGDTFIVTRNGVPVGKLVPIRRPEIRFTPKARMLEIFKGAPEIDAAQFRRDVDAVLDQNPEPRG